ncbi:MAG TPA: acyl-CoA dehydrogenase family protein [Candidatus Obscuribacter sp.]|nr:acyl-CoA dehydrogenase family protein [Candidatus Obscuribacter sp.]
MNTFLSAAQKTLQEQYVKFVDEVIAPVAAELDKVEGSSCQKEIMSKLGQNGYLGITVAKDLGGQGGTLLDAALFVEALGAQAAGLALAVSSHYSVVELISRFGSETQKSRYLPLLARGECFGAQAFSEEKAGSDLSLIETIAEVNGAEVKLTGVKTWVVSADLPVLLAVLGKNGEEKGVWLLDGADRSSVELSARKGTMGFRSARLFDVTLKAAKASADNQLKGADALALASCALDVSKTLLAACALGLCQEGLSLAAQRANTREQFGAPIAKNQGVQWKLADFSTDAAAARLLTYRAAWSRDGAPAEFRKFAAMAKSYAARTARLHSGEAVQIFGMLGASCDEPLERIYRDAKLTEIFEGTSELQKVILKEELGV